MSNTFQNTANAFHRLVRHVSISLIICALLFVFINYFIEGPSAWNNMVCIVSIMLLAVLHLINYYFQKMLQQQLKHITALEKWADLSRICGEIQVIPHNDDNLSQTILTLNQQLLIAKNSDTHLDKVLRSNALLDKDTGVGNSEFFNNRLDALLKEEDCQGAVYFIQFKDFDLVHALFGEQQSSVLLDNLIQTIKSRLTALPNYFIARRDDSELAIIVPDIFFNDAEKLADKLLNSLCAIALPVGMNKDEFIHIGVSYFSQAENSYQVKSEADMALRSAQLQGPSQWFMYDPGEVEHASAKGSLKWRTFLNHVIAKNALVIFFQPVISVNDERILHHEILTKIRDADGSLISARVFLPMAKKCGLIQQIDLLVFKQICRLLSYDNQQKDQCSLNLSIESLLSDVFLKEFIAVLQDYPGIHEKLIIEISEYHLVNHLEKLQKPLAMLHQLGIKLIADKVGQYVVSAQYLSICPIFSIKLHRSIVLNIHRKTENQIFIQSLKAICDVQKVNVYALGVENLDEWQTLKRLGVDGGQGHYFTEPVAQVAKAIHLP
ncbi:EAL domain-containing protein [Colwellia sp. 1_MG-2023]|uniref:EAL domain-containing protein n=1 Tax=Colwellia sp. 1_MG-2023 TaxID=3062649 RepID=UPI0026E1E22A|nr:EAL domain-containing protein [Colwellia sp. 1_MG-2023]MDO6444749.1 EAL domain-containing protein [Colwellia sp. 1_MG-2023]